MATFSFPADFAEHKSYIALLRKALLLVKPATEKKFLYFKQYPFGPRKTPFPLVLVDYDLNCTTVLSKAGFKPTAEGLVKLTEADELNFEATKGSLKRVRIKNYFAKLGPGIKAVYVPPGEIDDEESGQAPSLETQPAPPADLTAPTTTPPPSQPQTPPAPALANQPAPPTSPPRTLPSRPAPPQTPPPPTPPASAPSQMDRKIEFEENQFKLRQKIEAVRKQPVPAALEQLKKQALTKAGELGNAGKFAEAAQLLDQLASKAAASAVPPAPAKAPAPSPKLSAYMNATKEWKAAKTKAADGVFALKKAILEACDPELKDAVKARIDELNSILTVLDDSLVAKIQEAGGEADEERQLERNQVLVQLATKQMAALQQHPLAAVLDQNPFGTFAIRAPVEAVLTKITNDFAN